MTGGHLCLLNDTYGPRIIFLLLISSHCSTDLKSWHFTLTSTVNNNHNNFIITNTLTQFYYFHSILSNCMVLKYVSLVLCVCVVCIPRASDCYWTHVIHSADLVLTTMALLWYVVCYTPNRDIVSRNTGTNHTHQITVSSSNNDNGLIRCTVKLWNDT